VSEVGWIDRIIGFKTKLHRQIQLRSTKMEMEQMLAHLLAEIRSSQGMMAEMRAEMKADQEERKAEMETNQANAEANMKAHIKKVMGANQVKVDTNMKIHMQEIMVEMKDDQNAHMQGIIAKIDASQEKMEAIVHFIRSELDGKIQHRIVKVMEWQEIPKEEAAVHTMRAWQEEIVAC
jgi:hypothetical protein